MEKVILTDEEIEKIIVVIKKKISCLIMHSDVKVKKIRKSRFIGIEI